MNTLVNLCTALFLATLIPSMGVLQAQEFLLQHDASEMKVLGTSNLHDWEITVAEMSGSLTMEFQDSKPVDIQNLTLTIPAESLKSGKGGMDKNTYKALDTENHENITFRLKEIKDFNKAADGNYKINANGDLTINGVTKNISITFDAKVSTGQVLLTGGHELNMTHYDIEPPKALFGTITTGEKVTLKFKITFSN